MEPDFPNKTPGRIPGVNEIVVEVQGYARRLVETDRLGGDLEAKKARAARKAGVTPGTFENSWRGRLKSKAAWLVNVYRAALIRELEREVAALETEIATLRMASDRPDADEIFAAMEALQTVRKTLDRARG